MASQTEDCVIEYDLTLLVFQLKDRYRVKPIHRSRAFVVVFDPRLGCVGMTASLLTFRKKHLIQ